MITLEKDKSLEIYASDFTDEFNQMIENIFGKGNNAEFKDYEELKNTLKKAVQKEYKLKYFHLLEVHAKPDKIPYLVKEGTLVFYDDPGKETDGRHSIWAPYGFIGIGKVIHHD